MHGDNPAANAYGHVELDRDLGALIADGGPGPTTDGAAEDDEAQRLRDRQGLAGLTAEDLALHRSDEEDLGPPPSGVLSKGMHQSTGDPTGESLPSRRALFDGIPRTPLVQNAPALPGLTPVPVLPLTPMVPTPSNPIPKPPPAVPHPARRWGRTKVIKPDDSSAQALLVMLQKSRDRQEQSRLEDRRVAKKKSDQKEVARVG
ncbi:hypothetical protein PGTUg99_002229 [Puccinia graminis f. sp. tritici]|uniref:Uncharacterized protein n=1 Tax=Puccinia graminis f. sp. tritici TaxID=56615 RepID=A0A5B0RQN7_PUCGR|nr:hypothetical protein PGTUg99_002229 [Puccinia graminis f. sp. tritici]